ncbi:Exportin-4 [Vitis vinifera]|uniref:Exportin-4 n=1 Tax=Vitis vinifera TaxID=29760 RepID=A0A438E8Z2_VITVI|nr:Exportin-4 [Vitis vinifera]
MRLLQLYSSHNIGKKRILGNHGYLSIHDLFKEIHRAFLLEIIYRGAHLVKWKRVCCDKNFKGLGIRKLDTLNCVFLGKWIWRFSEQWDSLYRREYQKHDDYLFQGFGELIERGGHHCEELFSVFCHFVLFSLYSGVHFILIRSVPPRVEHALNLTQHGRFWLEIWVAKWPLKEPFPSFSRITFAKDAKSSNSSVFNEGQGLHIGGLCSFLVPPLEGAESQLEVDRLAGKGATFLVEFSGTSFPISVSLSSSLLSEAKTEMYKDLRALLQLIANLCSKDMVDFSSDSIETPGTSCLLGLHIVTPLISLDLLKYPKLCHDYFSLLSHMLEVYPEMVAQLNSEAFAHVLGTLDFGLHHQDTEVVDMCLKVLKALASYHYKETASLLLFEDYR